MQNLKQKKIIILGLGVTGKHALNTLKNYTNKLAVIDDNIKVDDRINLKDQGIDVFTTTEYMENFYEVDIIVKSPGIKYTHDVLVHNENSNIINDIELSYYIAQERNIKTIAITGTNGKTSTTTFMTLLLKRLGYKAFACGNIGVSPLKVLEQEASVDYLVLELSSFQLKTITNFKADYAFYLNFSPDHLDFHPTLEDYSNSKLNIIRNGTKSGYAFFEEKINTPEKGIKILTNNIELEREKYGDLKGLNPGNIKLLKQFIKVINDDEQVIIDTLKEDYQGLEHRCEYVGERYGVKFYNDSKATNVESTRIALDQLNNIVLLVGGSDKGEDLSTLSQYTENVKSIIAFGANRKKFNFSDEIKYVKTLDEAFSEAVSIAAGEDIVLLSPASASFDQYQNYEERGRHFKSLVNNYLIGE